MLFVCLIPYVSMLLGDSQHHFFVQETIIQFILDHITFQNIHHLKTSKCECDAVTAELAVSCVCVCV